MVILGVGDADVVDFGVRFVLPRRSTRDPRWLWSTGCVFSIVIVIVGRRCYMKYLDL